MLVDTGLPGRTSVVRPAIPLSDNPAGCWAGTVACRPDKGGVIVQVRRSVRLRLAGVGAALAVFGAGWVVWAQPALAAPVSLVAGNVRLHETTYSPYVEPLGAVLPNRSIPDVVLDGNRAASTCSPPVNPAGVVKVTAAFCWQPGDNTTTEWVPQGITTTADSLPAGLYAGAKAIVVSWHQSGAVGLDKGVRLAFVNYANPAAPKYRHVLLVDPLRGADGRPTFAPVQVHAGGIAWYGNYLYVVDTQGGLRVFEINRIWQVSTGSATKIGRQPDGTYHAFDYKYVIPQVFRYASSTAGGYPPLRHSFADRQRARHRRSGVRGRRQEHAGRDDDPREVRDVGQRHGARQQRRPRHVHAGRGLGHPVHQPPADRAGGRLVLGGPEPAVDVDGVGR